MRDLLSGNQTDEFNYDAHAREVGPVAASRVRKLMLCADEDLSEDLEEVASIFEEVEHSDDPQGTFNDALELLYDVGDAGNRVWVK